MKSNPSFESSTTFESAFVRLEEILNRLNTGTISLDESLKLYEEADRLITFCNQQLVNAEKKIEVLIKNRNGELALGSDENPITKEYKSSSQ